MSSNTLSTLNICEEIYSKFNKKVSLDCITLLWSKLGSFIKDQLLAKKGVKLNSFGTFSFTKDYYPKFVLSSELSSRVKVRDQGVDSSTTVPVVNVNYSLLATTVDLPRDVTEKLITIGLSIISQLILEGRSLLLNFRDLATFEIASNTIKYDFTPSLLDELGNSMYGSQQGIPQLNRTQNRVLNNSLSNSSPNKQQNSRSSSNNRSSNGNKRRGGADDAFYENKNLVNRNPILGDTPSYNQPNKGKLASTTRPASSDGGMSGVFNHSNTGNNYQTASMNMGQDSRNRPSSAPYNNSGSNTYTTKGYAGATSATTSWENPVVAQLKKRIVERGGVNGIRSVARLLGIMDNNGDKRISREEFK